MIDRPAQIRRAQALIEKHAYGGFFGTIMFCIENGHIVFIEEIEKRKMNKTEVEAFLQARPEGAEVSVRELPHENNSLVCIARRGKLTQLVPE